MDTLVCLRTQTYPECWTLSADFSSAKGFLPLSQASSKTAHGLPKPFHTGQKRVQGEGMVTLSFLDKTLITGTSSEKQNVRDINTSR